MTRFRDSRRYAHRVAAILLALLFIGGNACDAQPVFPRGKARIIGTVADSAGNPIIRAYVCREVILNQPYGTGTLCASPDTSGHYILDNLPAGVQVVRATCSGRKIFSGKLLAEDTLVVADGEERRFDVRGSSAGCDTRPFSVRRGTFEGHYSYGFEESRFQPCKDSISAWADFAPDVSKSPPRWPKLNDPYYPTFFVRWRGTVRGPWHFGHLGASDYQILVDSILTVRLPSRTDCVRQ
jgi:hypothetical protein